MEDEADQTVDAASKAFSKWKEISPVEKANLLWRWYQLIEEKEMAEIMTMKQGKPIEEARGEIKYANSFIRWYAEEARRVYEETVPTDSPQKEYSFSIIQ